MSLQSVHGLDKSLFPALYPKTSREKKQKKKQKNKNKMYPTAVKQHFTLFDFLLIVRRLMSALFWFWRLHHKTALEPRLTATSSPTSSTSSSTSSTSSSISFMFSSTPHLLSHQFHLIVHLFSYLRFYSSIVFIQCLSISSSISIQHLHPLNLLPQSASTFSSTSPAPHLIQLLNFSGPSQRVVTTFPLVAVENGDRGRDRRSRRKTQEQQWLRLFL